MIDLSTLDNVLGSTDTTKKTKKVAPVNNSSASRLSSLDNILAPEKSTAPVKEVKPVEGEYTVDKDGVFKDKAGNTFKVEIPKPDMGRNETISGAPKDTRKESTLLSRIGQIVLPKSLENVFGISDEQRKQPELSTADRVRETGTALIIKQMEENPEQVDKLEYFRRGLSFGNELDPTNLIKGYKADVSVLDLPEPTTVPQKLAQAAGNVVTMALAQPLIEAGAASLIGSTAKGAQFLEALKTASIAKPWTVGYGAEILKATGTGGLFGLITNNRDSLAKNVINTAGTFAAFTAIAYPIAQFFRPIIQSVGKGQITNENARALLTDPDVTTAPIAKTLWFRNPKDPDQFLKVTANGMEFGAKPSGAIVKNGAKDIPVMTSLDVEAFQTKPSVYQNLKEWITGKVSKKEIPFSVTDTIPKDAVKVDANAVETPNATAYKNSITNLENAKPSVVRTSLKDLEGKLEILRESPVPIPQQVETALIGEINATRDAFIAYNDQNREVVIKVPSSKKGAVPALEISVVPYDDGQFTVAVSADIGNSGMSTGLDPSTTYPSREAAVEAGKAQVQNWLKNEKESATPSELTEIKNIEKALGVKSKTEKLPDNIKAETQTEILAEPNAQVDLPEKLRLKIEKNPEATLAFFREKNPKGESVLDTAIKLGMEKEYRYALQIGTQNLIKEKGGFDMSEKKPRFAKTKTAEEPKARFAKTTEKKTEAKSITQKDKVKEVVKEEAKSIKQIAKETGIKEPNIRRILGTGAKEGTFERVDEGVYILNNGKEDIAFVHTADAVKSLPKLAKDGLKVDMVFLDIPYDTPAVKGGNRGVNYDLLSVEGFRTIMQAVSKIVRDENTPVYYMFSQAESGLKKMLKYNQVITDEGFQVIAKGDFQKLFNTGKPVTNVRGEVSKPEGILLFNKSGVFNEKEAERNLDFSLRRPKGYSTEKPAELLNSLILQGTKEGDTVIDPFAGSGVTGAEAIRTGRKAILIEKNPQVVEEIIKPRVKAAILEADALNAEVKPLQGEIGLGEDADGMLSTKELEINGEAVKFLKEEVQAEGKAFVEAQNTKPKSVNQSKGFASMDKFRETMEPIERAIEAVNPIEFPELVKLARLLTGEFPKVKMPRFRPSLGGHPLGLFQPIGDGKITLNPDLFKVGNEEQAAKTLAHEIGHLIDYLPEGTMARGNILGRLAVLKNFRKEFYPDIGVTRSNTEMQRELWALSKWWKPVDEETAPANYLAYRKSPPEIYADFISVLFNDPKLAADMAPESYTTFFKRLDEKPEVKSAYFELQDLLAGTSEDLMRARQEDIRKGFEKGEELQAGFQAKKEARTIKFWERLRQQLDDQNYPILKKQKEAEAAGHVFPDAENPKFVLQEQSLADNENFMLVDKIDKEIVKPLEKAGMIVEDVGEYLLLDRIINERVNIANPFGFNTKNAPKQMDFLKKTVGEKNFDLLQKKVTEFHDLVYQSVEEAVRVGSYNKELFETKIKPNKNHYASFQVVDYMQDYIPATVKGQVGTLKEVANPFISTILKTIALNRLNAYQRAKNATISMLKTAAPDEITLSKKITTDGKLTIYKVARDKGGLEVLEDGKLTSYDVDPYIAESFKREKVGDLNMIVSLIDKFNNKLFKPLVTTYNLGFAAAFNPIRDIKRNYKMIPNANFIPIGFKGINTAGNLLGAYVKSLPSAVRYNKGELDEFTKSLVESKAINAPVNDYNYDPARDDELGNILKKYGLIAEDKVLTNKYLETVRKTILKPVVRVLEGVRFIANTLEIVSKIAGARVRIAGGESGKQLAYNVRNFTGTPNFKVRGKQTATTNAIFVFSNIMKEGLKSDFKIATDPNTRFGYWYKTVKVDLLPKFLMFLAAAGTLGVGIKKWFDKVSEYDKSNYLIIPLGTTEDGKAIYARVPHDETGRLLSSIFWKMANFAKDGKSSEAQDIFAIGAGQLPSVSPIISVLGNWAQYLSGRNPYDAFHGRTLIDDTTWQAGGGAALKKMVQWTTNNLGFTKFATYDTSKNSGVETFMQVAPWFSSVIKISDYGEQERLKSVTEEVRQEKAKQNLKEREVVKKYIKEATAEGKLSLFTTTTYGNKAVKEILGHMPQSKEEQDHADRIIQKFKVATKRELAEDVRYINIIDANSNDEKKAILKTIKDESSKEEWNKIKSDLLQLKIVTEEVVYSVK
jgi:16S rRNA G966 N2-methylase RsmD